MLLFARATGYGFTTYDDPFYVTANTHVNAGLAWPGIVWAFTGHADYWHPLTWLSHMLDCELFGLQPAGHHVTSVLWHAANATLAFLVLRRLTGAFWTSAFCAALFAWHPLRVESVAWITERKDVMSGTFFLLTLWAWAAYAGRARAHPRPADPCYWLALALFSLGLMSKPMLVSVPLVLLVLDFWPLHRAGLARADWPHWRALVLEKIPFALLAAAAAVATVLMQRREGAFVLDLPFAARLANAIVSLPRYLGKFFWPFDLAVSYPHPGWWPTATVAAAALLVAGLCALAWWQRRARPWLLAGWLWFLVMLLPVSGLVQVGFQSMADRYTYLPLLGCQLALLWTLRATLHRPAARAAATVAASAALLGCAARTWDQQSVWRDTVALFSHAAAVVDRNAVAEQFLAYELASQGRAAEAEPHCRRALALDPRNAEAHFTLARILENRGRPDDAIASLRTALALDPGDTRSACMLGLLQLRRGPRAEGAARLTAALRQRPDMAVGAHKSADASLRQGQPAFALTLYETILAANPSDSAAHFGAALALGVLGRNADALPHLEAAARLQPDFIPARLETGHLLLRLGRPADAAASFRAALATTPNLVPAHVALAQAEELSGRTAEADAHFARALVLAARHPAVLRAWAETLARRRQFAAAVPFYERAVREAPAEPALRAELGFALALSRRPAEAAVQWEEALRLDPDFPGLRDRLRQLRP